MGSKADRGAGRGAGREVYAKKEKSRQQSRQWVVEQAEEQEGGCRAGRGQAGDLEQAGGHNIQGNVLTLQKVISGGQENNMN